jgi:hypothetical protein
MTIYCILEMIGIIFRKNIQHFKMLIMILNTNYDRIKATALQSFVTIDHIQAV